MRRADDCSARTAPSPGRRVILGGAVGLALAVVHRSALAAGMGPVTAATDVTAATFKPYLDKGFLVSGHGVTTSLTLVNIKTYDRGRRPTSLRDPFSLLFRGWPGDVLPAQIYHVQDPGGRSLTMFLSQVTADSSTYEATFD